MAGSPPLSAKQYGTHLRLSRGNTRNIQSVESLLSFPPLRNELKQSLGSLYAPEASCVSVEAEESAECREELHEALKDRVRDSKARSAGTSQREP